MGTEEEKKKIEEEERIRAEARVKAEKELKQKEQKKKGIGCLVVLGLIILFVVIISIGGKEDKKAEPTLTEPPAKSEPVPLTPEQKLESAYIQSFTAINKNVVEASNSLGNLVGVKSPILWTEEEIMLVAFSTVMLEESYTQAKELEPPEKFEAVHSLFLSGLSKYAEAMPLLRDGIDYSNADKINQSTDLLIEGVKFYEQATEKLKLLQ
ncbi:MAG: hypothetical protein ACKKMS_02535 [Candidatus Nealsonbacteria bacterium]